MRDAFFLQFEFTALLFYTLTNQDGFLEAEITFFGHYDVVENSQA